jgi:anti-sigma-K factor RskA
MSGSEDNLDVLAAEYALGLLDADGMARVAELRAAGGEFEAAVRAWEARLMPLAVELEAVAPPASVWAGIAAAVAPAPAAARPRLWDNVKFWRGFGLGAAALAAAAVVAVVMPRAPVAPAAVASLRLSSGGEFVATAQRAGAGMVLVVSPADVSVPAQKSAELWLILPGQAPLALGLLANAAPVVVKMPAVNVADVTLAVSIEPLGGSPTGKATGPVVGSAKFSLL